MNRDLFEWMKEYGVTLEGMPQYMRIELLDQNGEIAEEYVAKPEEVFATAQKMYWVNVAKEREKEFEDPRQEKMDF